MSSNPWLPIFLLLTVFAPLFAFGLLGLRGLFATHFSERLVAAIARGSFLLSSFSLLGFLIILSWHSDHTTSQLELPWFRLDHHNFEVAFAIDNLSLGFLALTTILGALVSTFSETYIHQEPGYQRFYLLLLLATFGMNLVVSASNLGVMVIGWEFLGISSTLLIAFFYARLGPITNAFRAFVAYRVADIGFLLALIYGHHQFGTADITQLFATNGHPVLNSVTGMSAFIFGGLLFFAAAGKSSILPFFPWLPRAMEGPTPSSALFYGAYAAHAGPFLLLRCAAVVTASPALSTLLIVDGALSALFATFIGRIRPDIKTALAYATMTQVSLIYIEIGLHWYYLAAIHAAGHMCLRTYQYLRSPSALHDLHVRAVLGIDIRPPTKFYDQFLSKPTQAWLYRLALEEGGIAQLYEYYFLKPFLAIGRWFTSIEEQSERGLERLHARTMKPSTLLRSEPHSGRAI